MFHSILLLAVTENNCLSHCIAHIYIIDIIIGFLRRKVYKIIYATFLKSVTYRQGK